MQLISASPLPSGATTQPIVVTENLCGSAPGVGSGALGTFFPDWFTNPPTALLPSPIIRRNTNQQSGYDSNASNQISGLASGAQWPLPGGYPYDAIVCVHGATGVDIDSSDTGLALGAFYLPASHHITIHWTTAPTVRVFRVGP
ncbi:MAG TPA: hypothetical protein VFE35_05090 [Candidatus Cybelea sp.]|jgi:hypothetical protein|nr:hypothetical protein [Candidatus Cybelea sp.]